MRTHADRQIRLFSLVWLVLMTCPSPALAHAVDQRFGDFYGGMLHPLSSLGAVLPLIGLSLLAGQQGAERARWILLAIPAGLLLGAIAGISESPHTWIEWTNRGSLLVVGLAVAAGVRPPQPMLISVAIVLGMSHGFENVADITSSVSLQRFLPGLVCTGVCLAAIAAAVSVSARQPWQKIAVRVAGSWIAAIGLLIMAAE